MSTLTTQKRGLKAKDVYTIIGILIIYAFGYVCPPFGGITPLGMKMLGVLIGLIFMTCAGCNIIASSLFALLAFVIHGYYDAGTLLGTWVGSTTTFQLVFCGALCVALRESGAMDVLAKKMLTSKICQGRPAMLMLMLLLAGFLVSIFISGAPFFMLFFGLLDSILTISGYEKDDPFVKLALLGVYVSCYGAFLLPWKGAMAVTVALFNSVLEPYGYVFNDWLYILIQVITWVGFDVLYVLCLKFIFKADMSKLKSVDMSKVESFKTVPDNFNFQMKVGIGSLLFCVLYIVIVNLVPKTTPGYQYFGSLGTSLIWVVPLTIFTVIRKNGRPIMNASDLAQKSSIWTMITLVGSLTMLGKICTDNDLGIRTWLVNIFTPLFGNMNIWLLLLLVVVFTTVVTQVVNGQVLTMGLTPVVAPIVCIMIAEQGIAANPTVVLTVISACASVAYMTVSGSVNAAYLLGREEISQKFVFTKGTIVLCLYMVWQYLVAMACNFLFAV